MPTGFHWKSLAFWIVVAVLLVFLFNMFQHGATPMGQSHDMTQIIINWFPMLLLIGVWVYFLNRMQSGGYVSPGQKEQTEAIKAATKALERIATALETRSLP